MSNTWCLRISNLPVRSRLCGCTGVDVDPPQPGRCVMTTTSATMPSTAVASVHTRRSTSMAAPPPAHATDDGTGSVGVGGASATPCGANGFVHCRYCVSSCGSGQREDDDDDDHGGQHADHGPDDAILGHIGDS